MVWEYSFPAFAPSVTGSTGVPALQISRAASKTCRSALLPNMAGVADWKISPAHSSGSRSSEPITEYCA